MDCLILSSVRHSPRKIHQPVFSQPSLRTVTIDGLFNKDTQAQVTTETIEFKAPESPRFVATVPFSLAEAHGQSGKSTVSTRARAQPEKRKASKRAWAQSEQGKASKRAWAQSEKGKASLKAYAQLEKRKAYVKAYYKVLRKTGDKEQARIAANQVADFIKESNKKK
ncbi:hypothetical protein ACTL6P_05245 [Endozoicomonas acroporae]|uniref:hypothetical protein n=1 Tax=Endozoicomonas acroporae TaxID=1701104 RepID=UPI000C77A24D|nr:hypothetical protein [Endozoicomonas acroporae]